MESIAILTPGRRRWKKAAVRIGASAVVLTIVISLIERDAAVDGLRRLSIGAWFIALSDAGFAEFKPLSTGARAYLLGLVKNFSALSRGRKREAEAFTEIGK